MLAGGHESNQRYSHEVFFKKFVEDSREISPCTLRGKFCMANVIDLFCGVGGFSLGAARAGFRLAGAIDFDPQAMQMHEYNFPGFPHWKADITQLTGRKVLEHFGVYGQLDGIIGGPPCQGFSRMGHQNVEDVRNSLFEKFFSLVGEIRPRFFLAENVLGILDSQNRPLIDQAIEHVIDEYFVLRPIILKASEHGVPTTRTRVFFFGYRRGAMQPLTENELGALQDSGVVHVEDALLGLPQKVNDEWHDNPEGWCDVPALGVRSYFYDRIRGHIPYGVGNPDAISRMRVSHQVSGNQGTVHSQSVRARYEALAPGESDPISKAKRLRLDGFCHTIRAGTGKEHGSFQAVRPIHPNEPRVITPREAARMQSFPDWFQFYPTKWHSFRQIGNSVCPILAEKLLTIISKAIELEVLHD